MGRPSLVEPAFGGADRRFVGVEHEIVAARPEVEAPRQTLGERRHPTERPGLRRARDSRRSRSSLR